MSFSVNTNITSLQAQDYLRTTSDFQAKTINRVTSGLRIISSGDDAAGLAIANGYRSDQAVLSQGVRNANDGLSTLQTIDGGMSNISKLLDRARTLATQSASDTFTGDRGLLNDEFQSVLKEINRQSQAIGLNSGGTFAKSLSVFIGGGRDSNGIAANANGSISVDLSNSTVDSRSLGLSGVKVSGKTGTDIGAGSATTNVTSILGNTTNKGSEAAPDIATFYLKGPGFDSAGVQISVNTKNIGGTADLAAAVNAAIQGAANGGTQAATALKNANISATITKDASNRESLSFSSGNVAFQVQAGDRMANALLGNFDPTNAAMTGADTHATIDNSANASTDKQLILTVDGHDVTANITSHTSNLSKQTVVDELNADTAFAARATASLKGNQVVLTSKTSGSSSAVTVKTITNLSTDLGLAGTAAAGSASSGASLGTTVVGSSNTAAGTATFTAANAGPMTFRFSGAGLTSPVDVKVTTTAGETLESAVNDLSSQVTSNSSLKGAGITISSPNLDGNHQLLFNATNGQAFHVDVTGDAQNQFGFGSFVAGNNASGNDGAFDYTTLTGATYDAGTSSVQSTTTGTATLQFSINGQASNAASNSIAVNLATIEGATAATVTGTATADLSKKQTITAGEAIAAALEQVSSIKASATSTQASVASKLNIGGFGTSGLNFTSVATDGSANAYTISFLGGISQSHGVTVDTSAHTIAVQLDTNAGGVVTTTASALQTYLTSQSSFTDVASVAVASGGGGTLSAQSATNMAGGGLTGLTFTAQSGGTAGNNYTVQFQHSGQNTTASVTVAGGNNIIVNLGTDAAGNVSSTAADVRTLLNGDSTVHAMVQTEFTGLNGTGTVSNLVSTAFSGGGTDGLTFSAKTTGTGGNSVDIVFQHSGTNSGNSVVTTGNHIVVNLATDGTGAINAATATAANIRTLLNGDTNTHALIQTELVGAGTKVLADSPGGTAVALSGGTAAGEANNQLNLSVGGTSYNVTLASGSNVTLNDIAHQINTSVTGATATVAQNQLVLTSAVKGAGASIQIENGSANTLLGLSTGTTFGTNPTGAQVASYLNQQFTASDVLQKAGLEASFGSVHAGQLTISSNNNTNFRINELAGGTSAQVTSTSTIDTDAQAAVIQGGNGGQADGTGTFDFSGSTTSKTLQFTVNGSSQTVNFGSRSYSKQEVLDTINSQLTLATASWNATTGKIQLTANTAGTGHAIQIGSDTNSTANTVLGFAGGAVSDGVAAGTTATFTSSNNVMSLKVDGATLNNITLTTGARTMVQVAADLTADQGFNAVATATVSNNHLVITSRSTGQNSKVETLAGSTAASVLGLTTGVTTAGTDTNIGYGSSGATFTGNVSSGASLSSAQVDSAGAASTSAISFTPLLYGSDAQTITIAANDTGGATQSLSMILHNDDSSRSGRSIDEAVSYINSQLQQSNSTTLKQVLAVKDDNAGVEKIRFMSTLGSFQVSVGSNANTTGLGASSAGVAADPAEQGTTLSSSVSDGGSTADISNQSSASAAVNALSTAVSTLGRAQAAVGKGQNNMNYAVNLAQSQLSNLAAAESRIRDADLASESANLTKAQILLQAGIAALAQANSAPQQVLSLLRG